MNKVIQYRNKCIGCGVCYERQPALWRMSKKDGKATLLKGIERKNVFIVNVTGDMAAETKVVAALCPVRIIKVV